MNIASRSPHTAIGNKRKPIKSAMRSHNKSGPGNNTSFKEVPLNLHAALQTRLSLSGLCARGGDEDTTVANSQWILLPPVTDCVHNLWQGLLLLFQNKEL